MKKFILFFACITIVIMDSYSQESEDPLHWTAPITMGTSSFFILWSEGTNPDSLQSFQKVYNMNFDSLDAPLTNKIGELAKHSSGMPVMGSGKMNAASGNLNEDDYEDVVAVWETSDHQIAVLLPHFDSTAKGWSDETGFTIPGPVITGPGEEGRIFVRTGNFDEDETDEFVIAYMDDAFHIHLEVYDTDGTLEPELTASLTDQDLSGNPLSQARFSITTGDFNNDEMDEIVLTAYNSSSGAAEDQGVFAQVYRVDGSSILPEARDVIFAKPDFTIYAIDLSINAFPSKAKGTDVLAVAYNFVDYENADDPIDNTFLQLVEVNTDLMSFQMDTDKRESMEKQYENGIWNILLASGDLNDDGDAELVWVVGNSMMVYTPDDLLNLNSICSGAVPNVGEEGDEYAHGYEFLSLANVDQYLGDEIIAVRNIFNPQPDSQEDQYFKIQVYGTQGDSTGCPTIARCMDEEIPFDWTKRNYALVAGNFEAKTVTIHGPVYRRLSNVAQPVVILNAPPIHFDVLDSMVYDINTCYNGDPCDFVASYIKSNTQVAEVTTSVQSTLSVAAGVELSGSQSAEVSAEPGGLGIAYTYSQNFEYHLFGTYGEHLESTQTTAESNLIESEVNATEDDQIYSTITDYDSWEYPYSVGDSKEYAGSIWAMVPVNVEGRWYPSKSISGTNYRPNHEVGNILSYYEYGELNDLPDNAESIVPASNSTTYTPNGSTPYNWKLVRTKFEENTADTLTEYGLDFKVSSFFYADVVSNNAYAYTHKTSVGESLELNITIGTIDVSFGPTEYRITPYAYWSKEGPLVIDYSVEPEVDNQGGKTWWQEKYGDYSDPTLILPWRLDPEKGFGILEEAKRRQTKDIVLDPLVPRYGDRVRVSTTVRNFSLMDTPGPVTARFYLGDPEEGGILISDINGATEFETDGAVAARSLKTIEFEWDYPDNIADFTRLYVVLDPDDEMEEIHENNNTGWIVIGAPQTLTGIESPAEISEGQKGILQQNYPNPFSGISRITYTLPAGESVTLRIYDVSGLLIKKYDEGFREPGSHTIEIDGSQLEPGIYFYSLKGSFGTESRVMTVIH